MLILMNLNCQDLEKNIFPNLKKRTITVFNRSALYVMLVIKDTLECEEGTASHGEKKLTSPDDKNDKNKLAIT